MRCDEARKTIPLFLYGELSFDEEERVEVHLDECGECREAVARERLLFKALDAAEEVPNPELLDQCRMELRQRLAHTEVPRSGVFGKFLEGFTIRFAPGWMQPVGAVAMLALGFVGARMTPDAFRTTSTQTAGMIAEPVASRVRYVEPSAAGQVQIVVDETRQRVFSGSIEDQSIQRLLLAAAKDPSDAGLRVESVDLLRGRSQSAEVRRALMFALQHDSNAGVRLKALDGLRDFADEPEARQALTSVLLKDENPGVRTQVIDLLIKHHSNQMVGVLQELMLTDNNGYVRMRCQKALHEMNASVETY